MPRRRRKPPAGPARYLAPAAFLAGVTIAVLLVHAGLQGGKTQATTTLGPVTTAVRPGTTSTTKKPGKTAAKRFYTVQTGDTFGTISGKTGVPIAQLEALNPSVSSNSLQVGQRLRIK
jgi:LysM repeat protein